MKKNYLLKFLLSVIAMCTLFLINGKAVDATASEDTFYLDVNTSYNFYDLCGEGTSIWIVTYFDIPADGYINIPNGEWDTLLLHEINDSYYRYIKPDVNIPVYAGTYELVWDLYSRYKNYEEYDFKIKYTSYDELEASEHENDEYFDDAFLINPNVLYQGYISNVVERTEEGLRLDCFGNVIFSPNSDIDNYRFSLSTNSKVKISFMTDSSTSNIKTAIYREESNGNITTIDASIDNFMRLPAGNYFIRIIGAFDYSKKFYNYSLSYTVTDESTGNYEIEDNDEIETANAIDLGKKYTGNIQSVSDVDYFVINVKDDCEFNLKTTVTREKANDLFSFTLTRLNDKGKEVSVDTFKSTSNPIIERKTVKAKANETYYLCIKASGNEAKSNLDYSFEFVVKNSAKFEEKSKESDKSSSNSKTEDKKNSADKKDSKVNDDVSEAVDITDEISDTDADYELEVGESTTLLVKKANKKNFKSSYTNIATVTKKGKIKAIATGTAIITVLDKNSGNVVDSYVVKVSDEDEADIELELGDTIKLPKVKGAKIIVSSNSKIVSVNNSKKITAKKLGTVTISFKNVKGKVIDSYIVKVVEAEE